jgi:hypothetical protein
MRFCFIKTHRHQFPQGRSNQGDRSTPQNRSNFRLQLARVQDRCQLQLEGSASKLIGLPVATIDTAIGLDMAADRSQLVAIPQQSGLPSDKLCHQNADILC